MIIVGNGLAPFRLVVFEEGDKPLPYENDQAKVDILAPFRLFVADDYCKERPRAVLLVCGG